MESVIERRDIPDGFTRCRGDGTFHDVIEPFYMKLVDHAWRTGAGDSSDAR